jgi:hypothetical protein
MTEWRFWLADSPSANHKLGAALQRRVTATAEFSVIFEFGR